MVPPPVVFCHNDLLSGNIMYTEATRTTPASVVLIDFEYSCNNYRCAIVAFLFVCLQIYVICAVFFRIVVIPVHGNAPGIIFAVGVSVPATVFHTWFLPVGPFAQRFRHWQPLLRVLRL